LCREGSDEQAGCIRGRAGEEDVFGQDSGRGRTMSDLATAVNSEHCSLG
jgi:hypothetical protein